jgi:hypothetical protein
MNHTFAGDPDHVQVVKTLRAAGARMYAWHGLYYCEVRSTLRAMGVSRQAGLRRLMASDAPLYQRLIRPSGASLFVTDAELNRLLGLLDGVPQPQDALIRFLHQRHGKVCWHLPWPSLAVTCGFMSAHPVVAAWLRWLCIEIIPALHRHGHYDPATNHEPPSSSLLDALELKEQGREMCNRFFPGLGDALAGDMTMGDADDITDWDRGDHHDW